MSAINQTEEVMRKGKPLPSWSVVIPVKNGGQRLKQLLASIKSQEDIGRPDQIIAVDSGSTDDSVSTLKECGAMVLSIPPEDFRHGAARNLGASQVTSDIIIFNNQDAVPDNPHSYKKLIQDLMERKECAGTCATLIPHHDCDPLTERDVLSEFGLVKKGRYVKESEEKRLEKLRNFHTVCCAVRRDVFDKIPFREVMFGEDYLWRRDAGEAGYTTCVSPARVRHSHNIFPHPSRLLSINADTTYFRREFEKHTIMEYIHWLVVGIFLDLLYLHEKKNLTVWQKMGWMILSPYVRSLQFWGRVMGKYRDRLPGWLVRKIFYYYR